MGSVDRALEHWRRGDADGAVRELGDTKQPLWLDLFRVKPFSGLAADTLIAYLKNETSLGSFRDALRDDPDGATQFKSELLATPGFQAKLGDELRDIDSLIAAGRQSLRDASVRRQRAVLASVGGIAVFVVALVMARGPTDAPEAARQVPDAAVRYVEPRPVPRVSGELAELCRLDPTTCESTRAIDQAVLAADCVKAWRETNTLSARLANDPDRVASVTRAVSRFCRR